MNNTETLAISHTQDTGKHRRKRKPKEQPRMNNPETLKTSDTQDTEHNKH